MGQHEGGEEERGGKRAQEEREGERAQEERGGERGREFMSASKVVRKQSQGAGKGHWTREEVDNGMWDGSCGGEN
eukprot:766748-Hanusia_phi.AAC.18